MKFKRYPSIENTYREKNLEMIRNMGLSVPSVKWCVTEKLHGSNLAIYADGSGCSVASRNNLLDEDESDAFYKFREIKQRVYDRVNSIFDYLVNYYQTGDIKHIIVYGELFGGSYPHNDVAKNNKVASVQKGVFYSPDIHFFVFDIVVVREDDSDIERFLDYTFVDDLCTNLKIPYCMPLLYGTLDECLKYPNDNISNISTILGLPPIEDNIMEGVIIKPVEEYYFGGGSRVILKNKNDKFKEKASAKKRQKVDVELGEDAKNVIDNIAMYITDARLDNIVSHLGQIDRKLIGTFIKAFVSDVFKDAGKDDVLVHLEKSEQKVVNKFVSQKCRDLILVRVL